MIKRLRVRNYLSLRDIDLKFHARNVLVGPNMSGKSSVIDCLRFLTSMVTAGVAKAFIDRNGFAEVLWKGGDESQIYISLELEIPFAGTDENKLYNYEIALLGGQNGFSHIEREALTVETNNKRSILIDLQGGEGKLLHANGNQAAATPIARQNSALEFNVPGWEGTWVKNWIARWHFYRLIPLVMKQARPAAAQNFLTEGGDNFSNWIMTLHNTYPEQFERIRKVAIDVLPGLEDLFTPVTQFSTTLVTTREKGLDRPVSVWGMSDGELVFLAYLSLIYAPNELGSPVICIEELENHLHPKLIETLGDLHTQRMEELGSQKAQTFVTTHSPYVVDRASIEELIVLEKKNGETRCTLPASKSHLKELLANEEAGLGDLWYSGALSDN